MSFKRNILIDRFKIKPWSAGLNTSFGPRPCFGFIGQSNVDGAVPIASLEAQYQTTYPDTQFSKQLVPLDHLEFTTMNWADELTYKAGNPNPGGFFALQFYLYPQLATRLNKKVYIVHHALGGTSLALDWKSTSTIGTLYKEAIYKFRAALIEIRNADGLLPSFKFIYWGQGENDARVLADANNYNTNLTNLINNFRSITGITAPWIICRLNTDIQNATVISYPYWATIQTAQDSVAAALTDVKLFNPDSIAMASDHIHYTTTGYAAISTGVYNLAVANGYI